jgi:hypothetical protein
MMKDKCLTDEEISAYVDGVGDEPTRQRIEEHLSRCGLCLHSVAELKQLVSSHGEGPVPTAGAIERAEGLIEKHIGGARELDITLAIRDGICRILESTGNLLPPRRLSPVAVRRERQNRLSPRISKSLAGYLVTVELGPVKDGVQPRVTLVEEATSTRPDGIKARLYSPGACETKYSHKGRITFSQVGKGFFRIDIETVGNVGLDVK